MKSELTKRIKDINDILERLVTRVLDDISKEAKFEIKPENITMIFDAYRTSINIIEEHYESKVKYEYLAKMDALLTEKDIESIEANKGKSFIEIMAGLKETSTHEDVLAIADVFIDGTNIDSTDQELVDRMTVAMMDICIFIRLYNKGRENEIAEEISKVCGQWLQTK